MEGENEPRVCFPQTCRGGLQPGESERKNEIRSEIVKNGKGVNE